jgi:hypothetical protein
MLNIYNIAGERGTKGKAFVRFAVHGDAKNHPCGWFVTAKKCARTKPF